MTETQDDQSPAETPETKPAKRRRSALLFLMPVLALAGLAFLLFDGRTWLAPQGGAHPLVGQPLQRLEVYPLTGAERPLNTRDLSGQVTLINFWGTWCVPCQVEMPHLMEIRERYRHRDDFQFVSVSCYAEQLATIEPLRDQTEQYLREKKYDLPVYHDVEGTTRVSLMDQGRTVDFFYPTTVLVDRDGVIRGMWTGYEKGFTDEIALLVARQFASTN